MVFLNFYKKKTIMIFLRFWLTKSLLLILFQELEFTNMQQVLTVMHAFYAAKVAQVDPNFSFDNSF